MGDKMRQRATLVGLFEGYNAHKWNGHSSRVAYACALVFVGYVGLCCEFNCWAKVAHAWAIGLLSGIREVCCLFGEECQHLGLNKTLCGLNLIGCGSLFKILGRLYGQLQLFGNN